jgi:hypothetical protein
MYWKRFFTIGGWFTGLITAGLVLAAGAAVYAGSEQKKASKSAANQMRQGVQTFEPIAPNAPETVDWRRSALDALNFNINNQARQQQFASQTNRFNTQQAQRMYRTFQPSFDSLQSQIGTNALSFARGELPGDVVSSLGRAASTRGLASGFGQGARGGGSGTALGNSLLRGLGLTSLDLSKFGTQLAMNASLQAKQLSPALYDPTQLAVGPQQAIGYDMSQAGVRNENARYWNQLQNQALMGNVSAQNTANTNATNTELAGQLAQAQAIQQAGATVGGGAMQYATNQAYMPQGNQSFGYGQPQMAGAVYPNAPKGYGHDSGGFYRLS